MIKFGNGKLLRLSHPKAVEFSAELDVMPDVLQGILGTVSNDLTDFELVAQFDSMETFSGRHGKRATERRYIECKVDNAYGEDEFNFVGSVSNVHTRTKPAHMPEYRRNRQIRRAQRMQERTCPRYEQLSGAEIAARKKQLTDRYLSLRAIRQECKRGDVMKMNMLTQRIADTQAELQVAEMYFHSYLHSVTQDHWTW